MKLHENGVYLLNGTEIIEDNHEAAACLAAKKGKTVTAAEAATGTMAYRILKAHNTSGNMENLQIKFDKLTSHDITFVGIIQTARASGQTATTVCVPLAEPSTKMTTCSD